MNFTEHLPGPRVQLGPQVRNYVEARLPHVSAFRTIQIDFNICLRIRFTHAFNRELDHLGRQLTLMRGAFTRHHTLLEQTRTHFSNCRTVLQSKKIKTIGETQLEFVTRFG